MPYAMKSPYVRDDKQIVTHAAEILKVLRGKTSRQMLKNIANNLASKQLGVSDELTPMAEALLPAKEQLMRQLMKLTQVSEENIELMITQELKSVTIAMGAALFSSPEELANAIRNIQQ